MNGMAGNKRDGRAGIQVTPESHAAFAKACEKRAVGRSMFDAASRLLEWFCRQPPPVQTAVLSDVDEGMEFAYAIALETLAKEQRDKAPTVAGYQLGQFEVLAVDPPPKTPPATPESKRQARAEAKPPQGRGR
jgi:hypothetical protein